MKLDDFKNLNPNDIGSWPLLPKIAALVVWFVLLIAAGAYLDWSVQYEDLEKKQSDEIRLREEFKEKKAQAVNLEDYKKQLVEIEDAFKGLLKQLPDKSQMDALVIDINRSGLGRGLQFELFQPGKEVVTENYAELPITIKIQGNYHDLGAFASDVAQLPRIVTINNISLSVGNPGKDQVLVLDGLAKTYRYLDAEESASQKKAAKAATKPAPGGKK